MTAVERNNYLKLRTCLLDTSNQYVNIHKLEKLKRQFELEINSPRRLENVQTVKDIIELLEKRAYLSENNMAAFREVAITINNTHFLNELQKLHSTPQLSSPAVPSSLPQAPSPPRQELRCESSDIKDVVLDLLINELGKSWADFARALNIREGKLDEIKRQNRNKLQDCAKEVLNYHTQNSHPKEWKKSILDALTECRRNDLRKSVENTFHRFYTYS